MAILDRFLPEFELREVDSVDVAAPPDQAYAWARHLDLARLPVARALFTLRTIPERLRGARREPVALRIDDIGGRNAGFSFLADEPGRGFAVGAVGRFWEREIPYARVSPEAFAAFAEPGWGKLAWEQRFEPRGSGTRITLELRVTATDPASWGRQRRYFRLIGPFSRFIRRRALALAARELGRLAPGDGRSLPGDEVVADANAQVTDEITIDAPPEAIWPWLAQMGGRRAGWYSFDLLDNAGAPSARSLVPELQTLRVGQELPCTPRSRETFVVHRVEPPRVLVLHGCYDLEGRRQVRAGEPRPRKFWDISWAFVLEPVDGRTTRLVARGRVAYPPQARWHARWVRAEHHVMQREQLANVKTRAERMLPRDTARDVGAGLVGALGILLDLATPFLRGTRSRWGIPPEELRRTFPGDALVAAPSWSWTHGVEIDAPAPDVWRWVAQLGQDRAGFYSYQWLENLAGCDLWNADVVHPEWQELRPGDRLRLHPRWALEIAAVEPGAWFVARASDPSAGLEASWLVLVEPLAPRRARLVSRYRARHGAALRDRLRFGAWPVEAVGFVMDRGMLLGVKARAERAAAYARA